MHPPGAFAALDLRLNPIEEARRRVAASTGYLDLTSSNPTQHGVLFPAAVLHAAAAPYWHTRRYTPDPHGNPAARATIAAWYAQRQPPLALPPDHLYLTASTSEAYALLFALLADPGDNLLAPAVSYPLFEYLAELRGVELRSYTLDHHNNWQIDGNSLLAAADARTRGVLIVSPHNPTGAVVHQPIAALATLGVPVICDEVFATMPYRVPHVPPFATLHPTLPVFMLNGISKLFALPDMKLGWIAANPAAHERYGARLELLNDTLLGANGLVQTMLPALFRDGMPFVQHMAAHIARNLDATLATLATSRHLHVTPPDGGYYVFAAVRGNPDEEALVLALLERGVLVHPGFFFGEAPGSYLLLSALTAPDILHAGTARLVAALADILA